MMHLGDEREDPTCDWSFPLKDAPIQVLLVRNGGERCMMCGSYSGEDFMFAFAEVEALQRGGKDISFCSDCWKTFLETSIRLYLKIIKGKCRVGGVLVEKGLVGPLLKQKEDESGA